MLEDMLIEYFDLDENWRGHITKNDEWNSAYARLTELVSDLSDMLESVNENKVIDELDKIESMEE